MTLMDYKVGACMKDGSNQYLGVMKLNRLDPWKGLPADGDVLASFALAEDQFDYESVHDFESLFEAVHGNGNDPED